MFQPWSWWWHLRVSPIISYIISYCIILCSIMSYYIIYHIIWYYIILYHRSYSMNIPSWIYSHLNMPMRIPMKIPQNHGYINPIKIPIKIPSHHGYIIEFTKFKWYYHDLMVTFLVTYSIESTWLHHIEDHPKKRPPSRPPNIPARHSAPGPSRFGWQIQHGSHRRPGDESCQAYHGGMFQWGFMDL